MIVTYRANEFAQNITSLYEQFLDSLQNMTLTIEASGTRITPKIVNEAQRLFLDRESVFTDFFYRDYLSLAEAPDDKKLEFWYLNARLDIENSLDSCLLANRGTFMAAIRFGGAFKGLSGLLKDMHGSMGYLVQQQARLIRWNVRTRDGRTLACKRMMFSACRHYAYRLLTLKELLTAKRYGVEVVQVGLLEDEAVGKETQDLRLDDLLYSEKLADKYFGYGSRNEVFYEVGEVTDAV